MAPGEVNLDRPRLSVAVAAVTVGLIGLALLIQAVEDSPVFGPWHNAILVANTIVALALLVLIFANVWRLFKDLSQRAPGARLKLRLLIVFAFLATAPVLIVYATAVVFLHRGIESWIDERVAAGLRQALDLSRLTLSSTQREDLGHTRDLVNALAGLSPDQMIEALPELRRRAGAEEITVFDNNYRPLATSSNAVAGALPILPTEDMLMQLRQDGSYVGLDSPSNGRLRVRTAVSFTRGGAGGDEVMAAAALFPLSKELSALAEAVQSTYSRYGELILLRGPIEYSFTLSLSVVVLLTLLGAAYVALVFAWRLVAPIQSLVAGTRAVARGDLDTRLPESAQDDIGTLVESFNDMTRRLRLAREQALRSAQDVEATRANLAAVLGRLTSGVIVIGAGRQLRLANEAAGAILHGDFEHLSGESVDALGADNPQLAKFIEACDAHTGRSPGAGVSRLCCPATAAGAC